MTKVDIYDQPLEALSPPELELAKADLTVAEAISIMSSKSQGCLFLNHPEGAAKRPGIVTEREFLMLMDLARDRATYPVQEILQGRLRFHAPDTSCNEALNYLLVRDLRYLAIKSTAGHAILGVRDFFKWAMNDVAEQLERYDAMRGFNEKAPLILQENEGLAGRIGMDEREKFLSTPISHLPLLPCIRIDEDTTVETALLMMREKAVSACAVVKWETLLRGIVTERDFLMKIFPLPWNEVRKRPIRDFMTASPHALAPGHAMGVAIQNFRNHRYRNLVIIDPDRFPIYILGVGDIFKEYLTAIGIIKSSDLVGARLAA